MVKGGKRMADSGFIRVTINKFPSSQEHIMSAAATYRNFTASIYATVYDVQKMSDLGWLTSTFDAICQHVKVGKIYLETHRDMVVADEQVYTQAQEFFRSRGVKVAGGITITVNERNRFQTYCYSDPALRARLQEIVRYTARLNDELILDDFFFTNCKCERCIAAKGERSWTEFRLEQMTEAAKELILAPARAANPRIKVVVKYPNWFEHFQGLGFNLETQPALFDGLYTGTETRDPVIGNQHFQEYHGYSIIRYFENLKPGGNGGGWVDPFGSSNLDRYAEQLWITLFAKAPEITMFNYSTILRPVQFSDRAAWQGQGSSLDFDRLLAPYRQGMAGFSPAAIWPLAAGDAFEQADAVLDQVGQPLGLACYKPFHSMGEDFLHSYLGNLGIPIDLRPDFPVEAEMVLLTECAKADPQIVEKIKARLLQGKPVMITSGLLRALQERGLQDIVELQVLDKRASASRFLMDWNHVATSEQPITIPQVHYLTNDSWEEISLLSGVTGFPLLHSATYGPGTLYVWVIPDDFAELYRLPREVLSKIKSFLTAHLYVGLDCPSGVSLFAYDNQTFIVESFLGEREEVRVLLDKSAQGLVDLRTGEEFKGEEIMNRWGMPTGKKGYYVPLAPHAFRLLRAR
jgi:hypothetical protein